MPNVNIILSTSKINNKLNNKNLRFKKMFIYGSISRKMCSEI